jgi:hypothetical protein
MLLAQHLCIGRLVKTLGGGTYSTLRSSTCEDELENNPLKPEIFWETKTAAVNPVLAEA